MLPNEHKAAVTRQFFGAICRMFVREASLIVPSQCGGNVKLLISFILPPHYLKILISKILIIPGVFYDRSQVRRWRRIAVLALFGSGVRSGLTLPGELFNAANVLSRLSRLLKSRSYRN